jgi:hypothetical protein
MGSAVAVMTRRSRACGPVLLKAYFDRAVSHALRKSLTTFGRTAV